MRTILLAIALAATLALPAHADITSNLLAWYKFEEGTGTTAADSSGNGKDGTLVNGAAWTNGQVGSGVMLDGTNDHILLPTALGIDNKGALTIAMHFKPTSLGDDEMLFSHFLSADQRIELALGDSGAGGNNDSLCLLGTGSSSSAWTEQDLISATQWQHWCMVFDGSQSGNENRLKFYFGGTQVEFEDADRDPTFQGTIPATTTNNGGTASYIGARAGTNFFLNGVIDEVRIYDRALTASDVGTLVNYHRQPILATYPAGGLADYRVVKIDSGELALCGASDANRIGFTSSGRLVLAHSRYAVSFQTTDHRPMAAFYLTNGGDLLPTLELEAAAATSITSGAVVYQAADGKISDTGTVRVGVANKRTQVTSPELWSVFPD